MAVVVAVNQTNQIDAYRLAYATLRCYCDYHQYPLHLLTLDTNEFSGKKCQQTDVGLHLYVPHHCHYV